jgi:hypothetical protein
MVLILSDSTKSNINRNFVLSVLVATICALASFSISADALDEFSGFYHPDLGTTSEDYAGAWLVSKQRLLMANSSISTILNLEGASFHVVRIPCHSCKSFLTRDYFDFLVEHQSSTTNQAPGDNTVQDIILKRIKRRVSGMERKLKRRHGLGVDRRADDTVAIMVFSTNSASAALERDNFQTEIRRYFFKSTFYSIYAYFPRIVIFTGSNVDTEILMNMSLPVWAHVDLSSVLEEAAKHKWDGNGVPPAPLKQHLPKYSLLHTTGSLTNDKSWDWVKYIYYTEGDLIMHIRHTSKIFDLIDQSEGHFLAVPHRMQVSLVVVA